MTAQQLKNSILQMAVQGKLVPQDPNDEPASVLLERIHAEKERLIKEKKIKREKNPSVIFKGADNTPYEKIGDEVRSLADEVPFDIPDSWEWVRLGNIGETNIGLTYKPSDVTSDGVPVLRSNNIQNGQIDYSELLYVSCAVPERAYAHKGDILICARNGSRALVGKSAIVDADGMAFGAFMAIYRSSCNPYIQLFINSYLFRGQLEGATTTTINQVTQEMLKRQLCPLPPIQEQLRIVQKYTELQPLIAAYSNAYDKAQILSTAFPEALKKSILQEAVQGKLVPQDPSDEPAEALLERIRAEKQRLIKEGKIKKDKHESVIFRRDNSHYEKRGSEEVCIDDEIPFEVPDSWMWTRLKSLGYTQTGNTPSTSHPEYRGGYIPFITPGDIFDGIIDYRNQGLSEIGKDVARVCPAGSILQVCIGGSIGKAALSVYEVAFNQQINAISPVVVSSKYVLAAVTSFMFLSAMKESAGGTATPILNRTLWDKMLIPLPPLNEQNRIVSMIEQLFPVVSTL